MNNLFAQLPEALAREQIQTLLEGKTIRIERIVSFGHASENGFWYDQDQNEWVVVLSGAARLRFEDDEILELSPGDFVDIPAHRRHRVEWTSSDEKTLWLAVHYGDSP